MVEQGLELGGAEAPTEGQGILVEAVAAALTDAAALPRVLLVTGAHVPALRQALLALAREFPERGLPAPILDLGILVAAPEPFLVAAAAGRRQPLVLVDATGGDLAANRWLRRAWLPRLPAGAVTVVALETVEDAWWADPGWRALARVVAVGGPPSLRLAPTPAHRAALIVAALAPRLTEDLLAAVVDRVAGPRLFEWLGGLPGIEQAAVGLVATRDTRRQLQAEAAQAPETARLRVRLMAFHRRRIRHAGPRDRALWAEGLLHLRLARHPVFADPARLATDHLQVRPLRPVEGVGLLDLVRETGGGRDRTTVARWWLERRPEAIHLCRTPGGGPLLGFMFLGDLDPTLAADDAQGPDDGLSAAHWALRHQLRLGPRDRALLLRGILGAEPGPAPTAVERALLAEVVSRWVADPRIRVVLASVRPGEAWTLAVALGAGSAPLTEYTLDGESRLVVALYRDPRVETGRIELERHLPRERFRQSVDATLRQPTPEVLGRSRLLTCRHFMPPVGEGDRMGALVERLLSGIADVEAAGTDPEAMATLRRLWRDPELPQRVLADTLGISGRTFRRRLAVATGLVADALWERYVEPGEGDD